MHILTSEEIKKAEDYTFRVLGLPSCVVMETAGRQVASIVSSLCAESVAAGEFVVVCVGPGNNGGDGFVVARVLAHIGHPVVVVSLNPIESFSGDAGLYAQAWEASGGDVIVFDGQEASEQIVSSVFDNACAIVDAMFGTGFKGELRGAAVELVSLINSSEALVVSVDIPSGVDATTGAVESSAVVASCTITFECLKVGHVLHPGAQYCGDVVVTSVGIVLPDMDDDSVCRSLLTLHDAGAALRNLEQHNAWQHKGGKGRVLVIGGSVGMCGAAKLSGEAALASGAGLVTLSVPESVANIMAPQLVELMCSPLCDDGKGGFSGDDDIERLKGLIDKKNAIVIGPGFGRGVGAAKLLRNLLSLANESELSIVLDADALRVIAVDVHGEFNLRSSNIVITPHHGEAAYLLGCNVEMVEADRLWAASELCKKYGCTVVLKGARTIVATDDGETCTINPAVTSILATAGSGDVLSGIIAAFCARGIDVRSAARLGVFVHGVAGEMHDSEDETPVVGVVASDIVATIGDAMNYVYNAPEYMPNEYRKVLPGSMIEDEGEIGNECSCGGHDE